MSRHIAVVATLSTVAAGFATLDLNRPAEAAVTSSTVTLPADGTAFTITDANPAVNNIPVEGTTDGTPITDLVDVRCYYNEYNWATIYDDLPVSTGGSWATLMSSATPYGTCVIRAVPANLPAGADLSPYAGSRVTTERDEPSRIGSGPNAGKVVDYYIVDQGTHAMSDFGSAHGSAILDTRLQHASGHSSSILWNGASGWSGNPTDGRSPVQVDGHNAYGPYPASVLFGTSKDYAGLPVLTYDAQLGASSTTITESSALVRCTTDTIPVSAATCAEFLPTGVQLDRTILVDDGGRQTHVTDVWQSTDGQPHSVSVFAQHGVMAYDSMAGASTSVGLEIPWVSPGYQTFTSPTEYPGPAGGPQTVSVRDSVTAADGDTNLPRGAVTFDHPPSTVKRMSNTQFQLRHLIAVPAGGSALVSHDYVIGSTESEVAAKAAASRARMGGGLPGGAGYRPDGLVRKGTGAYVGDNIYNTTGSGQSRSVKKKRSKKATFYVQVQNDGTAADLFRLAGAGKKRGFRVSYFAGSTDITAAVTAGNYTLANVAPGQNRVVRLVVKVKPTAKRGILRSWLVTATSVRSTDRADTVKASVRVRTG